MRLSHKNGTTLTWSPARKIFTSLPPALSSAPPFDTVQNTLLTWEATLQSSSLAFICLLAVVGNFLVALTLIRKELLVFPSNRLVFSLTGSNFVLSLLVLPFMVASVAEQKWSFGIFWCNFTAFLTLLFGIASIVTLAMIAVDRYFAIVKPMTYSLTITTSKSTAMLLWVWTQACVSSIPPLFGWSKYEYVEAISVCSVSWDNDSFYTTLLLSTCVLLPFIVMLMCYYFIFQVARTKCRKINVGLMNEPSVDRYYSRSLPSQSVSTLQVYTSTLKRPSWSLLPCNSVAKAIRTISIVLGAFLLTWIPYVTMAASELTYGHALVDRRWKVLATWLMYSGAISYPLVYGVYNRLIRKEIRSCVCRPGAKARRGLPRQNSRRFSSGGLFDYSLSRFHSLAKRSSTELKRASIDLGSLSFFRSRMRKGSQDSGAVMTESDLDSDVPSVPLYWFGRRWASTSFRLDNISTKFQKIRERPYLFTASDIHSLPILRAIDVGTEDRNLPCQVMPDVGRTSLITRQDVTSDCESSPRYPQFAGGPSANEKMINVVQGRQEDMKECKNEILFISRSQPVTCSDSVDEGISHDCVLEDLE